MSLSVVRKKVERFGQDHVSFSSVGWGSIPFPIKN